MLNSFRARPPRRGIVYLHSDHRELCQGDWVMLQDEAGDAFWVELTCTDGDPPHVRYEGVVRGLDSPLGIATRYLAHQALDVGDRASFDRSQIQACAPGKPGFAPLRFHRHHLGPAEGRRL